MSYTTLSKNDLHNLRVERIRFLEFEHARCVLMLEENPRDSEAHKMLSDVERRIALHTGVLTQATSESGEDTPAENPPDDEGLPDAVSPS